MVKFLLQRPIAVIMAFTACFIIGLITYSVLPVSLLPDIAIPQITIQVNGDNTSARELENTVLKSIRAQLMQVTNLRDMHSESRDGAGTIRLNFDYGTDTDLAFIEVNEKVDVAMNYLPKNIERPKVIKASATDIPVLYLNLTLKNDKPGEMTDEQNFLELSEFADNVIKRRIEQLPEVAMVDRTGALTRELRILPDLLKMEIAGFTITDLESVLKLNNIEPGSMSVRDGYYEYNIRFSSVLRTPEDVENIYIRLNDRIFQLKDFAKVENRARKENGCSFYKGKRAVTLAIIKQADENMDKMKESLTNTINYFSYVYPEIDFNVSRNQTELLDYTISNLQQNLALGFFFIFIVAILFLGDVKSPFVIGLSMIVSLITTFTLFYLFGTSLNIISLSGLILAQGMMVDNSIIVTENISQYRGKGCSLEEACSRGTGEVIIPMLSSSLTTIAVFVPLVFMSGIAGAIFYDEAFAVTAGLATSYFTGIMLLPVLYKIIYGKQFSKRNFLSRVINNPLKEHTLDVFYDKGVDFVFAHKRLFAIVIITVFPLCVFMFYHLDKERMPEIDRTEILLSVDWNENIHIDENKERINRITLLVDSLVQEHSAYVGWQQYLLNKEEDLSSAQAEIYFRTSHSKDIPFLQERIREIIIPNYPKAVFTFSSPENIFEKIFEINEADIVARLYARNKGDLPQTDNLRILENRIAKVTGETPTGLSYQQQLNIIIDREKLLLYNVQYDEVMRILRTAFKENEIIILHSYQQYLPVVLADREKDINTIFRETLVKVDSGNEKIPLAALVKVIPSEDLKTITAGKNGEYIPLSFYQVKEANNVMEKVNEEINADRDWEVDFSGSFFSNRKMMDELVVILFVSLLLMYFILAAQFESFVQPLVVLMEIPLDVAFALVLLWICGYTLNLMSAIGIVVSCGIIINDSILKLDAINQLRKEGVALQEAIHQAGKKRLRAIIMTSLTTICAMVPLLYSFDMGSELQKPLAVAMIGAMFVGTLVSLFIIPLVYWFIYRKHDLKIKRL